MYVGINYIVSLFWYPLQFLSGNIMIIYKLQYFTVLFRYYGYSLKNKKFAKIPNTITENVFT